MTPAIAKAKQSKIHYQIHEYTHEADTSSYGLEAAEKLNIAPERIFKTLVVRNGNDLVVGIVPVNTQLDLKKMAQVLGSKKVVMAEIKDVERSTGYVVGGVSPLGQKKQLTTFLDQSAAKLETLLVSAGRRGLEIELAPHDLAKLTKASLQPIAK